MPSFDPKYYQQDPSRPVTGPIGGALDIPLSIMPSSRLRDLGSRPAKEDNLDGAAASSDEDDTGDTKFLLSDDDEGTPARTKAGSRSSSVDTVTARRDVTRRPMTPPHIQHKLTAFQPGSVDLSTLQRLNPPSWAAGSALRALTAEVRKLQELQAKTPAHELGWYIDFGAMENMFQWIVELHSFDLALPLGADMNDMGVPSVVLEIRFGAQFPISPPFVRVVRPRFLPFMVGGGGHVTNGGAMCMELLTNSGWSPVNSMESVLLQVRLALCSLDPRPARLQRFLGAGSHLLRAGQAGQAGQAGTADYGIDEAIEAYIRAAAVHGWIVPSDLRKTAQQLPS